MKRIGLFVLCFGVTAANLCGCANLQNTQSVETSIVYVHDSISESISSEEDSQESKESAELSSSSEEETSNTKVEPVSLRDLNMLSGAPDINGKETIATGDTNYCIGMTIYDIEKKDTKRRSISYSTQGKYNAFNCSLALLNDSSKNSPLECFIEVYCDGELKYTSESISRGKLPIAISVDISGAELVEIKFCVTNPLDKDWLASMWASNQDFYPVSFAIVEPEFC